MVWQGKFDKLYVGGRWVEPATNELIACISPFTEELIAEVRAAGNADVDRAVSEAREAFDNGPWPQWQLNQRMDVLRKVIEQFTKNRTLMASIISEEMGCPISQADGQAARPVDIIDTFLELAADYPFNELRTSTTGNALVTREPVGVVAVIVPWNAPQVSVWVHAAPALLAGCTVILKPAPETAIDSYLMAEMLDKAGFPPGVISILPADREVSEYLVTRPGVDKVSFTGSTMAGRRIASLCGQNLKRFTLELGGKSAAIILDDADFESTVETLRMGALRNSGQICQIPTRILVSQKREAELLERMAAMVSTMPVGDPADPRTQIGPLVSQRQRERVEGYIQTGKDQGARIVAGGGRPQGLERGWFVEPTVFGGVDSAMTIAREEIFGPVLAVMTYKGEDDAVAIANDSSYGLSGGVFSNDHDRALTLARKIRTGGVLLNNHPIGFKSPFGGFKDSGIGRAAGKEGIDSYVETKSIGLTPELLAKLS
jgi:aldehyde dehydrogenase (NAD+)